MREALPNATFVGFTGTPLERDDKNTIHVLGDYADVYDIRQTVEDGATRPLYYESRILKLKVDEGGARVAEDEVDYVVNADRDGTDPDERIQRAARETGWLTACARTSDLNDDRGDLKFPVRSLQGLSYFERTAMVPILRH